MYKIEKIKKQINDLERELVRVKTYSEKRLKAIENGAKFGIPDAQDMFGAYFPCELLEVVDRDNFVIKFFEPSINTVHIDDVYGLTVLFED